MTAEHPRHWQNAAAKAHPWPASVLDPSHVQGIVQEILAAEELPPIVQAGHPALRAPALPFTGQLSHSQLQQLIEIMVATMRAAPGVGLAAPQLGIPLQLAVLEDQYEVSPESAAARSREPLELFTILNPRYTPVGSATAAHYEGCLSMAGWQAVVDRAGTVDLAYDDETGTARIRRLDGWQARIAQHETDHLQGTLYLDKAHTRSLSSNAEYTRNWAGLDLDATRRELGF